MSGDTDISTFLKEEGFIGPEAPETARAVLETAGLTRPGKIRIANVKLELARQQLNSILLRACKGCLGRALAIPTKQTVVEVIQEVCPHCQGSDNRRAVTEMVDACRKTGVKNLLIVGGTANMHAHLQQLVTAVSDELVLRCIDGSSANHTRSEASRHMQWADIVLIWGSTPLPHKVSQLYTHHPLAHQTKTISFNQRGIAALCAQVVRAVR